jgi:hypothetical protein
MSRCFYHPEIETDVRCDVCGKPICGHCRTVREGRTVCPRCIRREAQAAGRSTRKVGARGETPSWIGLFIPGVAQLLKGEIYKGSLLLVYFFLAAFADVAIFLFLAYGISIWDYFSPLVEEESKGRAPLNFRQFAGGVILLVGVMLLARNVSWALNVFSRDLAPVLAAAVTIAFGLFIVWYHLGEQGKEVP